jgi:hypothetical protein
LITFFDSTLSLVLSDEAVRAHTIGPPGLACARICVQ